MATKNVRHQIASEAARLIHARQEAEYHRAKRAAARRLGHGGIAASDLPTNREVRDELRVWHSRHESSLPGNPAAALRREARALMLALRPFRPRLVGDVLTGQLTASSQIELHAYCDDLTQLMDALAEHEFRFTLGERRQLLAGRERRLPLVSIADPISASIVVFDLRTARRHARRTQTGPAIERAGLSAVEALLRRDQAANEPDGELFTPIGAADRFEIYASLLLPLEQVKQSPVRHPEGDALYHSLQVFVLAREAIPYDEELLTAALLHDVGKGIDPQDHVAAGLDALDGAITPRTAWLIEQHPIGQALRAGELGARSRRRLAAHEDYDELMLLVECDRRGRCRGVSVPEVDEALDYLRELAESCDDQ